MIDILKLDNSEIYILLKERGASVTQEDVDKALAYTRAFFKRYKAARKYSQKPQFFATILYNALSKSTDVTIGDILYISGITKEEFDSALTTLITTFNLKRRPNTKLLIKRLCRFCNIHKNEIIIYKLFLSSFKEYRLETILAMVSELFFDCDVKDLLGVSRSSVNYIRKTLLEK